MTISQILIAACVGVLVIIPLFVTWVMLTEWRERRKKKAIGAIWHDLVHEIRNLKKNKEE